MIYFILYPGLPPTPGGTVTSPTATSYRVSIQAPAAAFDSYVLWTYPTAGLDAQKTYTRTDIPAGTTSYDITNLLPSAADHTVLLYTRVGDVQSDPAVLVFQQDDIRM